jgi:hypothetical protein
VSLLFSFALESAIRKVQNYQVGLKLNAIRQPLAYIDDVNLLGYNIDTIQKNNEILTDSIKEHGLEVNVEITKYMWLSGHQNVTQNQDIKIADRLFEKVE